MKSELDEATQLFCETQWLPFVYLETHPASLLISFTRYSPSHVHFVDIMKTKRQTEFSMRLTRVCCFREIILWANTIETKPVTVLYCFLWLLAVILTNYWFPIDWRSAIASLSDNGVSSEFRYCQTSRFFITNISNRHCSTSSGWDKN